MAMIDRANDPMMAEAKRFMEDYYRTFDANRADLAKVYRFESLVNFSGRMIEGKEAIVAKLTSLQQCRHQIGHIDCFPLSETGGVIVMVTGYMWLDGKPDALLFNQSFHLIPSPPAEGEGDSFYVAQQIWSAYDFNNHRAALA
ncbi:nuclear transport factor 2B-like [Syzygium oleosum]|uniref:nuclear transport factor 2B-like n=1 Tax=Syzygium oleosum TaxID=219896 RepID=UPI0024B8EE6F|nr:nuclear transport factor 2B-like [Syzygium oleosum]